MKLRSVHHVAIICSDYAASKKFYTEVLGLKIVREVFRKDRASYKLDLSLDGVYIIELFSFPNPPKRLTHPEALGLRHLAFTVSNLEETIEDFSKYGVACEPIRIDPYTQQRFTFFYDPDKLPIELYEKA